MGIIGVLGILAVAIYCICQAVRDFRRGDRAMGLIGAVCAGILLMLPVPIQTQAVKIDLPMPAKH